MVILTIPQTDTSFRKVVKTYVSKLHLDSHYLEWVESVDVEKKVELEDSDYDEDIELIVVPEFSHCILKKDMIIGLELEWDQEELLFKLTLVASNFRFTVYEKDKQPLLELLDKIKTWLYES